MMNLELENEEDIRIMTALLSDVGGNIPHRLTATKDPVHRERLTRAASRIKAFMYQIETYRYEQGEPTSDSL